jgi:hypothetical protein
MPDDLEALLEVLGSGCDDTVGIWEPVWSLNAKYPQNDRAQHRAIVQRVMLHLLRKPWITFFSIPFLTNRKTLISEDEANMLLNDDNSWEPSREPQVCYATTAEGREMWLGPPEILQRELET